MPVDFIDFDFERKVGQLVIARCLAAESQEIFGRLRDAELPFESVIPIAHFGDDDTKSIRANNTSAFCYRVVEGTDRLSQHAVGRAIDINPWLNPYLRLDGTLMTPGIGDRTYDPDVPGTIVAGGAVVSIFDKYGWLWGGNWTKDHDYQHFDKAA